MFTIHACPPATTHTRSATHRSATPRSVTHRSVTHRCAAGAAAAGLALTLAACGGSSTGSASHDGHSTGPSTVTSSGTDQQHNDADVTFAQSMIPHHEQAVEMAGMATSRAASPAVTQLAGRIRAAQDPEISTMKGWLDSWGQPTTMSGMTGHSMGSMQGMMSGADMTKLGTLSGPAFDREFLTAMTAHHTGAIDMARIELAQGRYGAAKHLATSIVGDQTAEIATMRTLLAQL